MRAKRKGPPRARSRAAAMAEGRDPRIKSGGGRGRNSGAPKHIGGSQADDRNDRVASATGQALSVRDAEVWTRVAPRFGAEDMMAAQLIAAHGAAMACYRGARDEPLNFARRNENLNQANKASRMFVRLIDALHRRGNARRKVTVVHVHVRMGGEPAPGLDPGVLVAGPAVAANGKSEE